MKEKSKKEDILTYFSLTLIALIFCTLSLGITYLQSVESERDLITQMIREGVDPIDARLAICGFGKDAKAKEILCIRYPELCEGEKRDD